MSTEKLKEQIKEFSSDKVKIILFILVVVSLVFNILLFTNNAHAPTLKRVNNKYQESQIIKRSQPEVNTEYPFGTKYESYKKYEDGEWKTYSNTTALEEHEIEDIRKEFHERQKLMHEHFKKQQELMNEMWESFYW